MDAIWAVGVASSKTGPRLIVFSTGSKERERDEMANHRESVARREVRVITEGGKGHTLRQREATYKSMTASHTNHHRAHCPANYCTSQSQENDKNQHGCVCIGGISVEPHSLSWSAVFSFSLSLSLSFLFSSLPLTFLLVFFSNCKYCTVYALCSCKRTIIVTASLLCGAHGKANSYGPIFSMELCK